MRISDLGESGVIRRIREAFSGSSAILGIGDDTAVVDIPGGPSILYCSDLVAENTHFIRGLHPPDSIAYKVIAVNVSDIGAMGGVPKFCTLSLALPGDLPIEWLESFIDGLGRACREFDVSLVGGDTSSAERIFADVSMIGSVEKGNEVRRSGARPGDGIYVSGVLGGSALGLQQLQAGNPAHPSVARHLYPVPRHRLGQAMAPLAHAMIDVSDGLSTDLGHILEESRVSARIYRSRIPAASGAGEAQVLHGGEDYELLIVSPALPAEAGGVALTRIGEITAAAPHSRIVLVDGSAETELAPHGYQHF